MTKILYPALMATLLAATPAFAAGQMDKATGADVDRTGSKAVEGAATGSPMKSETDTPMKGNHTGSTMTKNPVQSTTTGADVSRTGSKATDGSATGSMSGANTAPATMGTTKDQPVQDRATGADVSRTGSKAVGGSATGSPTK